MVSAHWEDAPVTLSSTTGAPLVRDFWGFPQKYYEVQYDAPAAPALAERVTALVTGATGGPRTTADSPGVHRDEARGLDHGAYVPLVEMYPDADVPVLQMSMPTLDPAALLDLGRRLAPLREEGVLVVGSGFTTHNLSWFARTGNMPGGAVSAPPSVSAEFDAWAAQALAGGDVDGLLDARRKAPAFDEAHPRSEHWAPLYVALGAALGDGSTYDATGEIDGFWYGLSKRSWTLA